MSLTPPTGDVNPFNVEYLAKQFNFEPSDVIKDQFFHGFYEVYFKKGKEPVAVNFFNTLESRGCHPQYFKHINSVTLNTHKKDTIIAAATRANVLPTSNKLPQPNTTTSSNKHELKKEVASIESAPPINIDLDPELKHVIDIAKSFSEVLPSAGALRHFNDAENELIKGEQYNVTSSFSSSMNYWDCRSKVETFLKDIKEQLPNLRKLLSNEELKSNLRSYFIKNDDLLIDRLEYFVNKNSGYLDLDLSNATRICRQWR